MKPRDPSICTSIVHHRRNAPKINQFSYSITQVWLDPSDLKKFPQKSAFWSYNKRNIAQIQRSDYFDQSTQNLANQIRNQIHTELGIKQAGSIRMLTQPRLWGWLFNPITIYILWNSTDTQPLAAILEVQNTPWKEKHTYTIHLTKKPTSNIYAATFKKEMHVSPFLEKSYAYHLELQEKDSAVHIRIDLLEKDQQVDKETSNTKQKPILETLLIVDRKIPTAKTLRNSLYKNFLSTHKTSFAIHFQAVKLCFKKVPFVPHPKKNHLQKNNKK